MTLTSSSDSPRVLSLLIILMTGLGVVSNACAQTPAGTPPIVTFSFDPPATVQNVEILADGTLNPPYLCNPDPQIKTGDFFRFLAGELDAFQNNEVPNATDLAALEALLGQLQNRVTVESDKYTKTPTIPAGSTTISLNDCYSDAEWKLFQSTFATVACDWLTHFNAPHLCSPELQQAANTPVQDTTPPVITLNGPLEVVVEIGTVYTDAGASAADNLDGDITNKIRESYPPIDTKTLTASRTYRFTYNVSDSAGNAATPVTRIVRVKESAAPVITLKGPKEVVVDVGRVYTDAGATASDNVDGDITSKIETKTLGLSSINGKTGIYTLTYNVSDSVGNTAELTRTVYVRDYFKPIITLNPSRSRIVLEMGSIYTVADVVAGVTAADNIDGDITSKIETLGLSSINSSSLNGKTGVYTLTHAVSDSGGNTTELTRVVLILESEDMGGTTDLPIIRNIHMVPADTILIIPFEHPEPGKGPMQSHVEQPLESPTADYPILTITAIDGAGSFFRVFDDHIKGGTTEILSVGDRLVPPYGKLAFQAGTSIGTKTRLIYTASDMKKIYKNMYKDFIIE